MKKAPILEKKNPNKNRAKTNSREREEMYLAWWHGGGPRLWCVA